MCMLGGAAGGITPGCWQRVARCVPALLAACQPPARIPVRVHVRVRGCLHVHRHRPAPRPPSVVSVLPTSGCHPQSPLPQPHRGWVSRAGAPPGSWGGILGLVGPCRTPGTTRTRNHSERRWGGKEAAGLSLGEGTWPHFQRGSPVLLGAPREEGRSCRARDGTQGPPQQLLFPNRLH